MSSYVERVADRAASIQASRLLLSLLALPFYLLGLLVGLLVVAFRWAYAAVLVGISDVTKKGDDDAG